jgi:hypothetical protein
VTDPQPATFTGLADLAASVLSPTTPPGLQEDADQAARRAWPRAVEDVATNQLAQRLAEGQPLGPVVAEAVERASDALLSRQQGAELDYPNSAAWLEQYLLPSYVRRPNENRWCPTWWEHPEALTRIEALWRSWEALRWDGPTGMAVWWRDYADPHMRVLLSSDGPFFDCARGHTVPTPFTVDPPPEGLF